MWREIIHGHKELLKHLVKYGFCLISRTWRKSFITQSNSFKNKKCIFKYDLKPEKTNQIVRH